MKLEQLNMKLDSTFLMFKTQFTAQILSQQTSGLSKYYCSLIFERDDFSEHCHVPTHKSIIMSMSIYCPPINL